MKWQITSLFFTFCIAAVGQVPFKSVDRTSQKTIEKKPIDMNGWSVNGSTSNTTVFTPRVIDHFDVTFKSHQGLTVRAFDGRRPVWIDGSLNARSLIAQDIKTQTESYLLSAGKLLRISDAHRAFDLIETWTDALGQTHLRMQQMHRGIPVYGGEVVLHADNTGIRSLNGYTYPTPDLSTMVPTISITAVKERAWQLLEERTKTVDHAEADYAFFGVEKQDVQLIIYHIDRDASAETLAYHISAHPSIGERWELFIDAHTGELIHAFESHCSFVPDHQHSTAHALPPDGDAVATATDLNGADQTIHTYEFGGTFYMIDASRSMFSASQSILPNQPAGVIWTIDAFNTAPQNSNFQYGHVTSSNNTWASHPEAVSAHVNGGEAYSYFKNVHGRESINGNGGNIISLVNVADQNGQSMDNAFWDGTAIYYGNGGGAFEPLAKALDVASHEMTHGVVQSTANLEYYGESGAMNESFADIFAAMIDRDWTIGEDVVKVQAFPSGALRSLSDPHNGQAPGDFNRGWQPKHVSEKFNGPEDNAGVHINSGIPNHAYYLFATAIGREKAERVFYRALTTYLTRSSQFIDLRLAAIRAAEDLYGASEAAAAADAFAQVGIGDGSGSNNQEDVVENPGQDLILHADENRTHLILRNAAGSVLANPLSQTDPMSKPSVTDDGSIIVFISTDQQMHRIIIDWTNGTFDETIIQNQPIWRNVVVSRDGSRIAAITEEENNIISVFDFNVGAWADFELYNPTFSEGVNAGDVQFADAMEFDFTGEWLMYDAFNKLRSNTGDDIDYWDIGFLRVWDNVLNTWGDGRIEKLFTGLPEGVSIGNPTFSKNSPFIIAFDFLEANEFHILGVNLETLEIGELFPNTTLGYPSYSRLDDQVIFDNEFIGIGFDLGILNVQDNKIERVNGSEDILFTQARWGVWFSNGERDLNTAVEELTDASIAFRVQPNPFDDILALTIEARSSEHVEFIVRDVMGRVYDRRLEQLHSGTNEVQWPLQELPAGLYVLEVSGKQHALAKRIVKI